VRHLVKQCATDISVVFVFFNINPDSASGVITFAKEIVDSFDGAGVLRQSSLPVDLVLPRKEPVEVFSGPCALSHQVSFPFSRPGRARHVSFNLPMGSAIEQNRRLSLIEFQPLPLPSSRT
jgi:hypothetical protein